MDEILRRFLDQAPIVVMVRATIARTVGHPVIVEIFERLAEDQYARELNFSTLARLMSQVVFRTYPTINAAHRHAKDILDSVTSVYNKLNGLEIGLSQALVAETARSLDEVIAALSAAPADRPVEGLRLRTLDGNFLAGTDHRLACLRGSGAAALPGMSLVVRDGRTGLLTDIIPCEDAYTNERAPHPRVLALVEPDDLWLGDRNFCTADYLGGFAARAASFLIRHRAGTALHPTGPESRRRHRDGTISEQPVRVGLLECRCVIIRLKASLRDETTEIRLVTNVPPGRLGSRRASERYRTRSRIEVHLRDLKITLKLDVLKCKTVDGVSKELAVVAPVYNLVRSVACRAAKSQGVAADRVSVTDTVRWPVGVEGDEDLSVILTAPKRKGRVEPRVKKRRPTQYDLMTRPRGELRKELLQKKVAA